MKPGASADAEIIRKGKRKVLKVVVLSRPGEGDEVARTGQDRLGMDVADIDPKVRDNMHIPGGVRVEQVHPDSPAADAGIEPGDIIVQLGYNAIADRATYDRVVAELPANSPVALRFFRRGRSIFRTIVPE
jgi:serine protease Do